MLFDVDQLRLAAENGQVVWRKHTLQRLAERHILQKGEVVRSYTDDRPFPSLLLLGWVRERPLHVVASYDVLDDVVYIITAYEPSIDVFEPDFKTKKQ